MLRALFWSALSGIAYTHAGYPAVLALLARGRVDKRTRGQGDVPTPPFVSVIVAAYDEEDVIAAKVENLLSLDYPRELLEVIVCSDGSSDRTVERASGADQVLDLPRGGKIRAQDAGVRAARGEIVAFSDANSIWEPDALLRLVEPFGDDPEVGYVCGQVRFTNDGGDSQEGAYWRYEMKVRELESGLAGVTAGNGAIYATRREAYVEVDPRMGHDLSFPFNLVKRGWRALYQPDARATEKMVPTNEGEFHRKRRMMSHAWPIVIEGGMLEPTAYPPLYTLELFSHRVLRYGSPFLHVALLLANLGLLGRGRIYQFALGAHVAFAVAAAAGGGASAPRLLKLARYYLLVTASPALGLVDYLRTGTPAEWEKAEGTR